MNEAEFGDYCRECGLYPEQVEAWRDACMNANDDAAAQTKQLRQANPSSKRLTPCARSLPPSPHDRPSLAFLLGTRPRLTPAATMLHALSVSGVP